MSQNMSFDKFKDEMVKIEYLEEISAYGHHPFPLLAFKEDGKNELNSLCRLKLIDVVQRISHYVSNKYSKIFVSLDFPPNEFIPNDFVLILQISNGEVERAEVLEYDVRTGNHLNVTDGKSYEFLDEFYKLIS